MTNPPRHVVVVGAGLAGLTAAATAAGAGARVTLLEARAHAGGRARTAHVDGFLLNQGAHALYRGGAAWEVLTGFDITPRGQSPHAGHAEGLRADGTLVALPGTARSLLSTRMLAPRAKFEVARILGRPHRLAGSVTPGTSMQEWIDARSRHRDVRTLLALLSRVATYCGDLGALDARAGVAQVVQAMTHGVVYLDDGWQQLVDAMQNTARAQGVTMHTRAKADAIDRRGDGFTVRTASGDLDADTVVFAVGRTAGRRHDAARHEPHRARLGR